MVLPPARARGVTVKFSLQIEELAKWTENSLVARRLSCIHLVFLFDITGATVVAFAAEIQKRSLFIGWGVVTLAAKIDRSSVFSGWGVVPFAAEEEWLRGDGGE